MLETHIVEIVGDAARKFSVRSHAPFSGRKNAAIVLLATGEWIPGVRVESASFSLTISPVVNAVSTMVAMGRHDLHSVIISDSFEPYELQYLREFAGRTPASSTNTCVTFSDAPIRSIEQEPFDVVTAVHAENFAKGIAAARRVAESARVPESDFPVGCILKVGDQSWIPGCNVEVKTWSFILCAERNAVGTAVSYGLNTSEEMFLSCARDPFGTPCGACRQILAERTPDLTIRMDRGEDRIESRTIRELIPMSFFGANLKKNS